MRLHFQNILSPQSTILNGIGQLNATACDTSNHRGCKYARISGQAASCAKPRTRLRLLNIGSDSEMIVRVDYHRMIIIEADGVDIEPMEVRNARADKLWVRG